MITNATPAAAAAPVAPDIRDIKPPVELPTGWEWIWWAAGAAVVLILLIGLWRILRRPRKRVSLPPPLPAHIRAKNRLREALSLITQPKPFVIAVSDAA